MRPHPRRINVELLGIHRDFLEINRVAKTARSLDLEHGLADEVVVVENKFEGVEVLHLLHGDIACLHDECIVRAGVVRTVDIALDGRVVAAVVRTEDERILRRLTCGRSIARIDIARHLAARNLDGILRNRTRTCRVAAIERPCRAARHEDAVVLHCAGIVAATDVAAIALRHREGICARGSYLKGIPIIGGCAARSARLAEGLGAVCSNAAGQRAIDGQAVVRGRLPTVGETGKPLCLILRFIRRFVFYIAVLKTVVVEQDFLALCRIRIRTQGILIVSVRLRRRRCALRIVVRKRQPVGLGDIDECDPARNLAVRHPCQIQSEVRKVHALRPRKEFA